MSLRLFTIKTDYIEFLRNDRRLNNVFDNKETGYSHGRKYIGILLSIEGQDFFAPLSSPKDSDYLDEAHRQVRKSILPIIRMTERNLSGDIKLLGTIKLSNMVPVPLEARTAYDINQETDLNYKNLVLKEYSFISANEKRIIGNANALYHQKTRSEDFIKRNESIPGYLKSTIDFSYAIEKSLQYPHHF
jgi:protein AbiQ